MSTFIMNRHLLGLVIVELLPDVGLVLGSESGPRLVSPPIVFMSRSHFYIIIELDDLENI